jgi:hypothetical protein
MAAKKSTAVSGIVLLPICRYYGCFWFSINAQRHSCVRVPTAEVGAPYSPNLYAGIVVWRSTFAQGCACKPHDLFARIKA